MTSQGSTIDPPTDSECQKTVASGTPKEKDCEFYEEIFHHIIEDKSKSIIKNPCG